MDNLDKYNYYNRLNNIHGHIFEFNKNSIKTSRDKVEFKCKKCGNINSIKLNTIIMSKPRKGCYYCSSVVLGMRESVEDKINKLKNKFPNLDFSKFEYVKCDKKSKVICHKHGEFKASYSDLLRKCKYGCPMCKNENIGIKLSQEEAIKRMKQLFPQFDYSKFEYKGSRIKSIIICPSHGEFKISYDSIMKASRVNNIYGCPKCANKGYSSYEKEIVEYIKSFYNKTIKENDYSLIINKYTNKYLELDIYLPDVKLAIEFNGKYYHSDEMVYKRSNGIFKNKDEYHNYKSNECNKLGITLLHISEEEYINNKEDILEAIKKEIKYI